MSLSFDFIATLSPAVQRSETVAARPPARAGGVVVTFSARPGRLITPGRRRAGATTHRALAPWWAEAYTDGFNPQPPLDAA